MGGCIPSKSSVEIPPRGVGIASPTEEHPPGEWKAPPPPRNDLTKLTYATTKDYIPNFKLAKVIKVYDGDTVTLGAELHGECYRFAARMLKYNSAELRSKDPAEKKKAQEARAALAGLVDGKLCRVEVIPKKEKWGRLLVILYVIDVTGKEIEVNQWMLTHKHGVPYEGGTKTWQ